MNTNRTAHDGARIYSRLLLSCYDFLIFNILCPYVWRCSPTHFQDLYADFMTRNHADIGVGTGYFLDKCQFPAGDIRIGLFDLQQNCLRHTAQRIARYQPETYLCNALEPIAFTGGAFDSVALGGILHCLPGNMEEKGKVFDSISSLMTSKTQIFGYTIVNQDIRKTLLSRFVFWILHKLKVINGPLDSASSLATELNKRFHQVSVQTIGCVAIFNARSNFQARF